ncbi:MAG: hypothetical protein JSU01_08730 [Bacteroidetes bacterium]|nr:hypothetical protein [Bacteroidota bacterium]
MENTIEVKEGIKIGHTGDGKGSLKDFHAPQIPPLNFGQKRETRHYTPWLVVRANYGDFGARPLAPGTVFWESPDVWVESSLGVNQPVVGEQNTVYARVSNYGFQLATAVMVKFWWADPSLAITESTAHLIGVAYANVPSGWSVDVKCPNPWVPVEVNGGHECLIAEAFIPASDPLSAPMDPTDDRHVGQKNEQLVMLKKGMPFSIKVKAINVTNEARDLRISVQTLKAETIHPLVQLRAANLPANLTPAQANLGFGASFVEGTANFVVESVRFAEHVLLRGLRELEELLDGEDHNTFHHQARFGPLESRTLEVTGKVPNDAQPGQTFLFRIVQRIGKAVTGGYTVHVVVTE